VLQVVLFDRHFDGPFFDLIQTAFSPAKPLKRIGDYKGKVQGDYKGKGKGDYKGTGKRGLQREREKGTTRERLKALGMDEGTDGLTNGHKTEALSFSRAHRTHVWGKKRGA
jgi:hypothetical protein